MHHYLLCIACLFGRIKEITSFFQFLAYVRKSFLLHLAKNLPKSVLDKNWPKPPECLKEVKEYDNVSTKLPEHSELLYTGNWWEVFLTHHQAPSRYFCLECQGWH